MAIINGYVDANLSAGKLASASNVSGVVIYSAVQSFVVGSTDQAGSIYRLFKGIPSDSIVISLTILNDALTGATSVKFGLYDVLDFDGVGAIIGTGDQFATAQNIASGNPISGAAANMLTNLSIANREVQLWSLVGEALYPPKRAAFDLCMTMTAMTTGATGNVSVKLDYIRQV